MAVLSIPVKLPQWATGFVPANSTFYEWVTELMAKLYSTSKRQRVLLFLSVAVFYTSYKYWRIYGAWSRQGVPGPRPLPLWGNALTFAKAKNLHQMELEMAKKYGYKGYYGTFLGTTPSLTILTPELVNEVMIKQFNNFPNRMQVKGFGIKYFRKDLSRLRDDEWRKTRNMLSPTFTGMKLKKMVPLINGVGKSLCSHFEEVSASESQEFELKSTFRNTTLEVIINVLFGLSVDVQENPENEIAKACWALVSSNDNVIKNPLLLLAIFVPFMARFIRIFTPTFGIDISLGTLIEQMTLEIIKVKKENPSYAPKDDFLHTVLEQHELFLKTKGAQGMDQESMVAQCLIFLFAGFETTANLMMWTCYYMARHPDLQQAVVREMQLYVKDKDNISYDDLSHLDTLDNVLHETLRMNSLTKVQPQAVADTVIGPGIQIKKGWLIESGVYAMHQDPKIWGDPEFYRPSRWRSEEKDTRSQYVFNAFGAGPRNCIGMRLALFEVKMALTKIFLNYEMLMAQSTPTDLTKIEYKKSGFRDPAQPFKLRVAHRK